MAGLEAYIRAAAQKRGIDPNVAIRVARSEGGLNDPVRQSDVLKNGIREPSYGPFQLLVGGGNTGFPAGLGNDFMRATGLDPRKPENAYAGIDYALDTAKRDGWGRWYGAKAIGLGNRAGIGDSIPTYQDPMVSVVSKGTPQGSVAPGANGVMPPLAAAPDIPKKEGLLAGLIPSGDEIGKSIFGEELAADLKKAFGPDAPSNGTGKQGLALLGKAMGGGDSATAQANREAATITPSQISVDDSAARMAAGTQLMSALMAARRNKRQPSISMGA